MSKAMGRLFLAAAVMFAAPSLWGQEQQQQQEKQATASGKAAAQAASESAARAGNSAAALRSGTKISAELASTLDTRTAKPGQEVVARVTKDVKQGGKKIIHKGDKLMGTVQSVEAGGSADAGSRLAVMFDRVVQGESTTQLHTVVNSIVSTPRETRERLAEPAAMAAPAPAAAPSGGGSSGGGGLVGGVTSTVGSTVGAATSAVGGVGSTLGGAVDATTQTAVGAGGGALIATPARAIRINSEANAENNTSASSLLSTREGHLRLESGTQMQFRVAAESEGKAKSDSAAQKPASSSAAQKPSSPEKKNP